MLHEKIVQNEKAQYINKKIYTYILLFGTAFVFLFTEQKISSGGGESYKALDNV